ncbi:MAG: putative hemagglutinin-related protein, partial [Rhizobacter sp.]|nr:putative hemagglutinin-related protein [Rhizobacter sp.]
KTLGSNSDLVLDKGVSSTNGDLTLVAGRSFTNNTALDSGIVTPGGRYMVYAQAPTNLSNGDSARGMTDFSKHYGVTYTGSTPSYAGSGNWFFYATTPTLSISVPSGTSTVQYGSTASLNGLSYTGFIDGDTMESLGFTGALNYQSTSYVASGGGYRPAGTYNNTLGGAGSYASSEGYALSVHAGSGTLVVTPKDVVLSGGRMYDASTGVDVGAMTGLADSALANDRVALRSNAQGQLADANVGNGKTVSFLGDALTGGDAANYRVSGTLDVTQRTITLAADDRSMVYGNTDPALTFNVGGNGLAGNDTLASVFSGALNTATGAAATAGTHAIGQGTLASNGNYAVTGFTDGTLSVAKRQIELTADNQSKVYGDADPALTYQVGGKGFASWDNASTALIGALAAPTGAQATAGSHAIGQGTLAANDNYEVTGFNDGTLTVAKRRIEVAADNQSKVYGDADAALTYQVGGRGLAAWDEVGSVVSGALTAPTAAAATAGTHAIGQGTLAVNDNYELGAFKDGTLTVAQRAITVAADAQAKKYGDADPALTFQVGGSGLASWDNNAGVFSGALSAPTGAAATAGAQSIVQGTLAANPNYVVSTFTGNTLMVAKRKLTVTAESASVKMGEAVPGVGFSIGGDGLATWDTVRNVFTGALATADGTLPGTYPIDRGTLAASGNYDLGAFIAGELVVTQTQRPLEAGTVANTLPSPASLQPKGAESSAGVVTPVVMRVDANGSGPGTLTTVDGGFAAPAAAPLVGGTTSPTVGGAAPASSATLTSTPSLGSVNATQGVVSFSLPATTFVAANGSGDLSFKAAQADGKPLPSWLAFDPATLSLTGQAPAGFEGRVTVSVTATDATGAQTTTQVELVVGNR